MKPISRLAFLGALLTRRRKPELDRDLIELDELIKSLPSIAHAAGASPPVSPA